MAVYIANKPKTMITSVDDNQDATFITQKLDRNYVRDLVRNKTLALQQTIPVPDILPSQTQATILLNKKAVLLQVDAEFERMKLEYRARISECENRRIALEEKQAKMRNQVIKFEKFVLENDAKLKRAEAKVITEKKIFNEKVKQIALMNDQIAKLHQDLLLVKKDLCKYASYS